LSEPTTTEEPAPEVVHDDRREALLAVFGEHLGDALLESKIKPGLGLWVRVATDAWSTAAEVARDKAGLKFFDFLSAIDWLPSPYGRYEDSSVDVPFPPPMPDRSTAIPGYAGGDSRI
jgi:NADH-quinone oxidoreductase subunit C